MRDMICMLLSVMLLFVLVLGASQPPALPAPRVSAWWGLLCPWLFGAPQEGDTVTFTWPVIQQIWGWLRLNA